MKIQEQLSPKAAANEIAFRIKQYRILNGMTREDLAEKSLVSESTIKRFESGEDIGFQKVVSILAAVGLMDKLDLLVPDQSVRPSMHVGVYTERKRASRKKEPKQEWKWGDEK